MEERKIYRFQVSHPAHGETEVEAGDRYGAVTGAAREWGVRWSTIGTECKVQLLGEVSSRKKKGVKASGKADKKRNRNP